MTRRMIVPMFLALCWVGIAGAADPPNPDVLVDRMIEAAGGDAFAELGVLKLEVSSEEIHHEGGTSLETFTAYVDTANLGNLRMELPGELVIARVGAAGWSTSKGVLDDRPQTPSMAYRHLNQSLFVPLLPFSLKMEGVWAKEVVETTWEDQDAWALLLPFAKGFFVSPVLETTWRIVVDKDTYEILAVDFMPPVQFREVEKTGVRYGILATQDVEGAKIPAHILAVGLNLQEEEVGSYRVTKIESSVYSAWAPTLFINPRRLEELEGE